jgi:hypothetical protein
MSSVIPMITISSTKEEVETWLERNDFDEEFRYQFRKYNGAGLIGLKKRPNGVDEDEYIRLISTISGNMGNLAGAFCYIIIMHTWYSHLIERVC